ncbi:MAG: LytR/AlgR family response regulator transcription factor [Gemmatimonadales bacterium]
MSTALPRIRTLIVEDAAIWRDRLRRLFAEHPEFEIVGEAASLAEATILAATARPDAVTIDIRLPDGSGLELLQALETMPRRPVAVVVTGTDDAMLRSRCVALGAVAVIDKAGPVALAPGMLARRLGVDLSADRPTADESPA